MPKAYYEFKDKTSSKFWEIDTKGKTVTVRFGKIGTDGQTTAKTFGAPRDATAHAAKVTAEKVKKGYRKTQLKALGAPKTTKRAKMKPPMSAKKASETRTRSGRRSAKQHSTQPTPEQPRKSYWKQFYGAMKWFDVAEQPPDLSDLPREFAEAKRLWNQGKDKHLDRVVDLVKPFVAASFVIGAINGWRQLFPASNQKEAPEIIASRVRVTGIDWSVGPIPLCKAEAWFKVPVVHGFDDLDLDVLREADGVCLEDAVCFKWSVPGNARTDELDFTYGSHSGVEFWIDEDGDGNESPGVATPQSEDEGRVEVVSMAEELAGLHGQQREAIRVSLERSAKAGRIILVK